MKVLVSAPACHPRLGSESHVGWEAVNCLAQDHQLWVLTGARNRPDLEQIRAEGRLKENIHFIYAGRFKDWHPNRLRAQLQGWEEYIDFSNSILPIARELHQQVGFDVAHHITLVSWRVPSPLWKLGIPFIFGPVGGNESFPSRFLTMLSLQAAAFEIARKISNAVSRLSPHVRECIRRAAHVFAVNSETEALMARLRGTNAGVSRLLAYFHSDTSTAAPIEKNYAGPLRLFAGGSLDGRKGVALAIHALARAKNRGLRFSYRFGGKGPEFEHVQNLALRLGLRDEVVLGDSLAGQDYRTELEAAHIYLLPSLRDSAGITLAEAMRSACVPIVADCGGPGEIVTSECGFKVPPTSPAAVVDEISNILMQLDGNRDVLKQRGPAAAERIARQFSRQHYRETVNAVYQNVIKP